MNQPPEKYPQPGLAEISTELFRESPEQHKKERERAVVINSILDNWDNEEGDKPEAPRGPTLH